MTAEDEKRIAEIREFYINGLRVLDDMPWLLDRLADTETHGDNLAVLLSEKRKEIKERDARIERLEAALRQIASCKSRWPGDVVSIAEEALK